MIRGRYWALAALIAVAGAAVAEEAQVTVYTDKAAFLAATGAAVATDGGGGAPGELPRVGEVEPGDGYVPVGDVLFRVPPEGLYVGTEAASDDWTPLIPGPDLVLRGDAELAVSLVNSASPVHAMGIDLVETPGSGGGAVELEVAIMARGEVLHSFRLAPPAGKRAFVGVWSGTPFDTLRVHRLGSSDGGERFFGIVYIAEEGLAPGVPKTLLPSDSDAAGFGTSTAASGDVAVAGAPSGVEAGAGSGGVYVFERDAGGAGNWGEVKQLLASDEEVGDAFGGAVAASGDLLVAGAKDEDTLGSSAGAAYLFERDEGGPGNWGEVMKLLPSDGAAVDRFGSSVAASSDVIVVGSPGDDNPSGGTGSAYVFERHNGGPDNWGEIKKLRPSASVPGRIFGDGVGVSDHRIVVGSHGNFPGAIYIFKRNAGGPGNWGEVDAIVASDTVSGHFFGHRVAISGEVIVAGAPDHSHGGGTDAGSAYVFERNAGGPGNWGEVKELLNPDPASNDNFGEFIAVSGDVILAGVPLDDDGGTSSGSAYLFERDVGGPGNWGQTAKLTDPSPDTGDRFGAWMATSGNVALAGVPGAVPDGRAILFGLAGPCDAPTALVLTRPEVTDTQVFEACYTIEAFSKFGVGDGGEVTLRAGKRVALGPGFGVAPGGSLVVDIDPGVGEP